MKLKNIETEEQKLVARLVSDICRQHIPAQEKIDILEK